MRPPPTSGPLFWFLLSAATLCCRNTRPGRRLALDARRDLCQRKEMLMAATLELKLKEGDRAPEFSALTSGGKQISLQALAGKDVILYFYPRDDTPGCTKEACAFRDDYQEFTKRGVVVLGVSIDPVKAHDKFVAKFKLPFPLLADEDKRIVQAYGVWGQKSFMGRKYLGTHRVTFWIGGDGRIRRIWTDVKAAEHAREILQALKDGA